MICLFLYRPPLARCGSLVKFPADTICDPATCSQLVCARDHSLCRTCQMAPTAKLLKGPPVWGAGSIRSCRVCVTLAFAVVRRCGCDSMPIQPTGFGLLWKWPKHSERNPSNRKGKPSPGASRCANSRAAAIERAYFFGAALITGQKLKCNILGGDAFARSRRKLLSSSRISEHPCRALNVVRRMLSLFLFFSFARAHMRATIGSLHFANRACRK